MHARGEPAAIVAELTRVLRPDGRLVAVRGRLGHVRDRRRRAGADAADRAQLQRRRRERLRRAHAAAAAARRGARRRGDDPARDRDAVRLLRLGPLRPPRRRARGRLVHARGADRAGGTRSTPRTRAGASSRRSSASSWRARSRREPAVAARRGRALPSGTMAFFEHEGQRIAYTVYGDGPRVTVLLPGLLLSQRMQEPLAEALAERGERVIVMDPLGHGRSDRPRDMWRYSMTTFGAPGGRAARPAGDRAGGDRRHVARRERHARGRLRRAASACAGWCWRCRCSTTRCSAARSRSRRCSSR